MNEIRVAQKLQIKLKDDSFIHGKVLDYTFDRIMIKIDMPDILLAKRLKELDDIYLIISTHLGVKYMHSSIITELNKNNCIIVEANQFVAVEQKREFVRVISNLCFDILIENKTVPCVAIDISAGGIAFSTDEYKFNINDRVKINFHEKDLGKKISCDAIIIKVQQDRIVAQYDNLSPYDEDKITGYVFKLITYKDEK